MRRGQGKHISFNDLCRQREVIFMPFEPGPLSLPPSAGIGLDVVFPSFSFLPAVQSFLTSVFLLLPALWHHVRQRITSCDSYHVITCLRSSRAGIGGKMQYSENYILQEARCNIELTVGIVSEGVLRYRASSTIPRDYLSSGSILCLLVTTRS